MRAERVYQELLWQDPDRVSGALCFYGTRLPVKHMFEHLEAGYTLEAFCEAFSLSLDKAKAVLELAPNGLEALLTEAA
ncbi:MAG: DUF433 domain-containing protein [Fimbriimonadaceae bacterium]